MLQLTKAENLRSSLFFFFGDKDATLFFKKCLNGDYIKTKLTQFNPLSASTLPLMSKIIWH